MARGRSGVQRFSRVAILYEKRLGQGNEWRDSLYQAGSGVRSIGGIEIAHSNGSGLGPTKGQSLHVATDQQGQGSMDG